MKKRKEYTNSDKRKLRDFNQTDWQYRLDIAMLINQGVTIKQIADREGITYEAVRQIWNKIKNMTVQELEANLGRAISRDLD